MLRTPTRVLLHHLISNSQAVPDKSGVEKRWRKISIFGFNWASLVAF